MLLLSLRVIQVGAVLLGLLWLLVHLDGTWLTFFLTFDTSKDKP